MSRRNLPILILSTLFFLISCSKEDNGEAEEETGEISSFELRSEINIPGTSTTDVWGFEQAGKEYAIVGNIGSNGSLSIVNVTDPDNPEIVSTTSYPAFDMKVWQNYLYVVDGTHDHSEENSGMIYDISDPNDPVAVGNFPSAHNIFIDDRGYLYLSGRHVMVNGEEQERGITIFDLKNSPTDPELVWSSELSESHDVAVIGNRMFDFHGRMGTFIYDVTNPSAPTLLGAAQSGQGFDHSGWATEDGNFLFVTNELAASTQHDFLSEGGPDVVIWDISDVSNPVQVGEIHDNSSRVHNLYIVGNLAYISYYSAGLKIFDVTNPKNPELLYTYDTNGAIGGESADGFNGAFGVYPFSSSGNIYVSDVSTDLFVFSPTVEN